MAFSKRMGIVPQSKQLQIDSMDEDLQNGLWNAFYVYFLDAIPEGNSRLFNRFEHFLKLLYVYHYKLPIDTAPYFKSNGIPICKQMFYKSKWNEIYDLIEFLANIDDQYIEVDSDEFKTFCNNILEEEFSGYRFVDNHISPITNTIEIKEIEEIISKTEQFTSMNGANIHFTTALNKLSDRENPDYRNSIKESISAIESIAKTISQNKKDTLGSALDQIKTKIDIHPALEKGFKQIYGYTSDQSGIRHGLIDKSTCDFDDAKYMLVSCSAFANYLISKASTAQLI